MINSQEIIERSVYRALLDVAVKLGYSVDPNLYQPPNKDNEARFLKDCNKLKKLVTIYGTGNSEAKGSKITPRIVVNARGFYPGAIGMPKELIEAEAGIGFMAYESPYETIDQQIDVHLVAGNQEDLRLLHQLMFWSLPQRGYIKPYNEEKPLFSGNIFIENVNFYDSPNNQMGILEKVYQYVVKDCLLENNNPGTEITPIKNIEVLAKEFGYSLEDITLNIENNNP